MKKYSTEMAKLIALVLITPLLVMAYTKIENTVSEPTAATLQDGITVTTPVSIGLINKIKTPPLDNISTIDVNHNMLFKSLLRIQESGLNQAYTSQKTDPATNRFAMIIL